MAIDAGIGPDEFQVICAGAALKTDESVTFPWEEIADCDFLWLYRDDNTWSTRTLSVRFDVVRHDPPLGAAPPYRRSRRSSTR
jgi:hypothetical protein